MKKSAKLLSLAFAGTLVMSLAGCGQKTAAPASSANQTEGGSTAQTESQVSQDTSAATEKYKIGVLQLTQHAALDAANQGFVRALDEAGIDYDIDQQNASNDQSACLTIANTFASSDKDLILAIATPAAQAVASVITDTPVLITAVTDPADADLVDANDAPGANVTGTSDLTPVKEQIGLMKQLLPEAQKVGILYSSAESNSAVQVALAKEAIEAEGMEAIEFAVSSSNEIQTVVESMVGKVDAIYAPTDNTIAAGMATVALVANENKLPVICGEKGMVEAGGLATYGIDYEQLGYLTGQQAVRILTEGANPAEMAIEYLPADKCELTVNQETADILGIDVSAVK